MDTLPVIVTGLVVLSLRSIMVPRLMGWSDFNLVFIALANRQDVSLTDGPPYVTITGAVRSTGCLDKTLPLPCHGCTPIHSAKFFARGRLANPKADPVAPANPDTARRAQQPKRAPCGWDASFWRYADSTINSAAECTRLTKSHSQL